MKVILLAWHPASITARTTLGFADVGLPDLGLELKSVCVKRSQSRLRVFVVMPSAAHVQDGRQVPSLDGGYGYTTLVRFIEDRDFEDFGTAVIDAVREEYPEAFTKRGRA